MILLCDSRPIPDLWGLNPTEELFFDGANGKTVAIEQQLCENDASSTHENKHACSSVLFCNTASFKSCS